MKKFALALTVFAALIGQQPISATPAVLNLNDISQEVMEDFCNGKLNGVAIECAQDTRIPVEFFLKGDFLAFNTGSDSLPYIHILRTFYIKNEGGNFLFSLDMQEWKQLTELITGNVGVSLNVEKQQPKIWIGAEINQRP